MAKSNEKAIRLNAILDEVATITTEMEGDEAKNTSDNREKVTALLTEGDNLRKSIEQDNTILGLKAFATEPVPTPAGGDGDVPRSSFAGQKSLGQMFVESDAYKGMLGADGKPKKAYRAAFETGGFLHGSLTATGGAKATFDSALTGLETYINYYNPSSPILVPQQRLTVRDLLAVGSTNGNSVPYIKETSFTNAATTVAESGEKPEATLVTEDVFAPVKKIAVVLKVTDEMFADFPALRSYIDARLRFMVMQREEAQLINGNGSGSNITGILNSSPQTQSATTPGELDAVLMAIEKIRNTATGGYEPDGIVINPADWTELRMLKDTTNGQYYGGGPFYGPYGNGGFIEEPLLWGLRPVITNAITSGTALVGAFRTGAMIFQREGISVEAFNQNEDDVVYNRVTLRVEERLALAVFAPKAFCTVTDISF